MYRIVTAACLLGVVASGCNRPGVAKPVGGVTSTSSTSGSGTALVVTEDTSPTAPEIVRSSAADLPPEKPKGGVQLVSFDDLKIGMPVDAKFRPVMLEANDGRVQELFGKQVIVAGYMDPTDSMKGVTEFILLRNLDCKFGPGGQADHLVRVYLADGTTTSFTDKIVYAEGKLVLNPFPEDPQEPLTYSIYDLKDAKVSTRRPPRVR